MKNNKHTIAYYQKQKNKLDDDLIYFDITKEQLKNQIEAFMRSYYQKQNKPEAYSKASYDLMKYAKREISRVEFISKYSFITQDNYIYYTFIQYGHIYTMLENKRKEYRAFIANFKALYPDEALV